MEGLSEEERKALRGSKFAPLPPPSSSSRLNQQQPRLAHPGGPLKTNKAAALAKFLERKLQDPDGLSSINPQLVELAVENAKSSLSSSGASSSGTIIHHVTSFGDSEDSADEGKVESFLPKKQKKKNKKKKRKKNKKQKALDDREDVKLKKPKKKLKL